MNRVSAESRRSCLAPESQGPSEAKVCWARDAIGDHGVLKIRGNGSSLPVPPPWQRQRIGAMNTAPISIKYYKSTRQYRRRRQSCFGWSVVGVSWYFHRQEWFGRAPILV